MGSSTGSLLVEDDDGRARHPQGHPAARLVPFRGRVPPAASARTCGSRAIRARIRSGATRSRRCSCTQRLIAACARDRQARARAAHHDRAGDGVPRATTRTWPRSRRRRTISRSRRPTATSGSARCAQMNPPVRDAAHRGDLARRSSRASSTCSAPITRRIPREEKAKAYPASPSGMTGVQTLVPDHARSRQRRAAVAGALRRSDQRRAGAAVRHRLQRAASRPAMMPTSPSSISSARETITNQLDRLARGLDAL